MEGRLPATTAPLFDFPYEILSMILQYIDHPSLSSLALANSDCLQISRSARFHSVCFNYSPQSWDLLHALSSESKERSLDKNNKTSRPAIGSCIRRITVATDPGHLSAAHQISLSQEFNALDKSVQDARLDDASHAYYTKYIGLLSAVLSDWKTLPHVELLDWEDRASPPRSFFDCLPESPIQHLKLYRLNLEEEYACYLYLFALA